MGAIGYLARIAVTGTVAGIGIGASSEQIRDALGGGFVAARRRKSLRLDHGLLEFNLYAGSCENIAVQVHRLAGEVGGLIPDTLSGPLEGIADRVSFEYLRGISEDYLPCRWRKPGDKVGIAAIA
jgi:hypothetical protein